MPAKFDPSVLFERWRRDPARGPYKTEAAAVDAVARGDKALWQTGFSLGELAEGSPELVQLMRAAFERGLAVTFVHRGIEGLPWDQQVPEVYVLPLDQTWRIAAIHALWDTAAEAGGWSLAAEAQHSRLLGYTAAQRTAWLAHVRYQQAAYGGLTVYTLLTAAERRTTEALGKRCLCRADELVGRELFFHRERELLKRDAFARLPKGLALARVGLDSRVAGELFGRARRQRGLSRETITAALAQRVTEDVRTNVQVLGAAGWT